MKPSIYLTAILCSLTLVPAWPAVRADDLAALKGDWSVKKKNEEGQSYTQTLQIDGNKFVFKIVGETGALVLIAKGNVEVKKQGPFQTARFFDIKGGSSEPTDDVDDRVVVYLLDGNTWTIGSNFDKDRNDDRPKVDEYRRK